MVHLRLNEKETNPNPHINFITALPGSGDERARQLLRALAAQVKPVMKSHGFTVNSFEEVRVADNFLTSSRVPGHSPLARGRGRRSNRLEKILFSSSMNGTPCLRAETGTRERRLVSHSSPIEVHAVSCRKPSAE